VSKNQYSSAFTGILILLSFAFGCTKIDTTTLGENLIPVVDNIHTFDTTFSVIATNYDDGECDTIHRSNLQALGIISNDPLFGKSNASIYVELKPMYFHFARFQPALLEYLIFHFQFHTEGTKALPFYPYLPRLPKRLLTDRCPHILHP
jgi:hypothetical protein